MIRIGRDSPRVNSLKFLGLIIRPWIHNAWWFGIHNFFIVASEFHSGYEAMRSIGGFSRLSSIPEFNGRLATQKSTDTLCFFLSLAPPLYNKEWGWKVWRCFGASRARARQSSLVWVRSPPSQATARQSSLGRRLGEECKVLGVEMGREAWQRGG